MSNKLRFFIELKPYPYLDEAYVESTKWGCLKIVILSNESQITLLETEWEMAMLLEWFSENEQFIKSESLINKEIGLYTFPSESLAQALNRLQECEFTEDEESLEDLWVGTLFKFRQRHSLRFGLRGAEIPEIIIGFKDEAGEISLSSEKCEWIYKFDMNDFFADFHKKSASFYEIESNTETRL
jgi:hypothetical protein